MIRPELIRDIEVLAGIELVYANQKFPIFASPHEGYAVLKEEVEETLDEAKMIQRIMDDLWDSIKGNDCTKLYIGNIQGCALRCAAEAIQVAAMCKKYRDSLGGEWLNDKQ